MCRGFSVEMKRKNFWKYNIEYLSNCFFFFLRFMKKNFLKNQTWFWLLIKLLDWYLRWNVSKLNLRKKIFFFFWFLRKFFFKRRSWFWFLIKLLGNNLRWDVQGFSIERKNKSFWKYLLGFFIFCDFWEKFFLRINLDFVYWLNY